MSNPFASLNTEGLTENKDVLGGSFGAFESGLYDGTIKAAYAGKSDGGAQFIAVVVETLVNGQKREYRETLYVTNRQGQNFYEKDGQKSPLPGFTTANDLALLSTGHSLDKQNFEERVINVYNFDQRKEVPTKVLMAVDMVGKPITLGILKQTVNKNVKVGNEYKPTNEKRDENVIDKVFHTESGKTVSEFTRKIDTAEFKGQWSEKNTGQTRDKFKPVADGTGAGIPGAAPSAGSTSSGLFGG